MTLARHKCSHVSYTGPPVPPGRWRHDQVHAGHGPKEQAAMTIPSANTGHERAGSDASPDGRPVIRAAEENAPRPALPRVAAFWLVAGAWFLLLFAAAAPSPLYGVYQTEWRFSAITLTAVFGVYALGLLVALLVFGSVSDYLGRRRVISVAIAAGAGACGLFLAAHGVGLLFAARALSGAAVGTAAGAVGAALIDLQPVGSGRGPVVISAANLSGLAAGALGTSALVQYGQAPTHLVWWLLLGAFAVAAVACWRFRRPRRSALASCPRYGHGWRCRDRHAGRSRWPCRL